MPGNRIIYGKIQFLITNAGKCSPVGFIALVINEPTLLKWQCMEVVPLWGTFCDQSAIGYEQQTVYHVEQMKGIESFESPRDMYDYLWDILSLIFCKIPHWISVNCGVSCETIPDMCLPTTTFLQAIFPASNSVVSVLSGNTLQLSQSRHKWFVSKPILEARPSLQDCLHFTFDNIHMMSLSCLANHWLPD